jgi:hypothetical protein
METWIPLLQSLVWPVFVVVLFICFRDWFRELLEVIKKRVEGGSEVSIGPGGITLGITPKLEEPRNETSKSPRRVVDKYAEETKEEPFQKETAIELARYFYLVHSASYNPAWSRQKGRPYYTIRVWLEADSPEFLDKVSKVVYHLHPTFPNPDREVTTRDNDFELKTYAWGQFNLSADVYFEDGVRPLKLFRYLNF